MIGSSGGEWEGSREEHGWQRRNKSYFTVTKRKTKTAEEEHISEMRLELHFSLQGRHELNHGGGDFKQ